MIHAAINNGTEAVCIDKLKAILSKLLKYILAAITAGDIYMKRKDLVKYILSKGCVLSREGGKYSVFSNPATKKEIPLTRHPEVPDFSARKICRELGIELPL